MSKLIKLVSEVGDIMQMSDAAIEQAVNSMISRTRQYVKDNNLKSLVVGISGGLDSAVVAAILNEENTGVPLIGLSIPINSNAAHMEQAQWVGDNYCTVFDEWWGWETPNNEIPRDPLYDTIIDVVADTDYLAGLAGFTDFPNDILQGNIKARLRMITLYDLARKTNGMVLSTDNLSEYLAGFWTINGDVGDWGIIQNVWKGFELPQIAKYMDVRDDIITQKPSDGLSVTLNDTDEAQLGMTYQEFDTIISIHTQLLNVDQAVRKRLVNQMFGIDHTSEDGEKVCAAINRWSSTRYKRVGTINLSREDIYG